MTPLLLVRQAIVQHRARQKAALTTAIQQIAAKLEPAMRKRFLAAVQSAKSAVDLQRLAQAIASGDVTKAQLAAKIANWPERFGELAIDLRAGFQAGINQSYEELPSSNIQLRMDLINPYAVHYADRHLPQIVRQYAADAREIIRDIIAEAVSGNLTVQDAANLIKESIGLHPQYERAVEKFRNMLIADGIAGDTLKAKVDRYTQQLLKARATTIARTEIIQAQSIGQRLLWNEAAMAGIFNRQAARRTWQTAFDERTCPLCAVMDGQTIAYGDLYTQPENGQVDIFGNPLYGPPLHPNCRCSEKLDTTGRTPLTVFNPEEVAHEPIQEDLDPSDAARQVTAGHMTIAQFLEHIRIEEWDREELNRLIQAGDIQGDLIQAVNDYFDQLQN